MTGKTISSMPRPAGGRDRRVALDQAALARVRVVGVGDPAGVEVEAEAVHQRIEPLQNDLRVAEVDGDRTEFRPASSAVLIWNEEDLIRLQVCVLLEALLSPPLPPLLATACSSR